MSRHVATVRLEKDGMHSSDIAGSSCMTMAMEGMTVLLEEGVRVAGAEAHWLITCRKLGHSEWRGNHI